MLNRYARAWLTVLGLAAAVLFLNGRALLASGCRNTGAIMVVRLMIARSPDRSSLDAIEGCLSAEVQRIPASSRATHLFGLILAETGHPQQAISVLELAYMAGNADVMTLYTLADLLEKAGRPDEALEIWRQLSPVERRWIAQGQAAYELRDLDTASSWFHKALAVAPDSATAHFGLGQVYEAQGLWAEALEHYRAALENDGSRDILSASQRMGAYVGAGMSLYRTGRAGEAIPYLSQAADRAPFEPSYHRWLGYALMQAGHCQRALAEFLETEQLHSQLGGAGPGIYIDIGEAYACLGNTQGAIAAWRRALELDPDNTAARIRLNRLGQPAP